MTQLRLILLTTTAIAAVQATQIAAYAETASQTPFVVAQQDPNDKKPPPKGPPPRMMPPPQQPRMQPPPQQPRMQPPPQQPRMQPPPQQPRMQPPPQQPRVVPPTPPVQPRVAPVQTPQQPRFNPPPSRLPPPNAGPNVPRTNQPQFQGRPNDQGRPNNTPPVNPGIRDVTPQRDGAPQREGFPPRDGLQKGPNVTPPATTTPNNAPGTFAPNVNRPPGSPPVERQGGGDRPNFSPPGMQRQKTPAITTPLPSFRGPPQNNTTLAPIAPNTRLPGGDRIDSLRSERRETTEGGRTVFSEPGRLIIKDPNGQAYVRHNEVDRFRIGARDVRVQPDGNNQRTIIGRPDGSQIITINDRDGNLQRRLRRGPDGREIILIDNERRGPRGIGGFFVSLPPPIIRIPRDRYIVDYYGAPPDLIYDTLIAPPVDVIERPYTLDEIRYSPSVRERMPSVDIDTINFDTGSWDIPPDQAESLRAIADAINRAIAQNPRTVFLIEGHTDAVGSDVDNLSLSDRRAEAAAELLTQQFGVPPENLTSQGYGEQYLKVDTPGPERRNRRVTIRNITELLNGGQAAIPPPPPGVGPR